MHQVGDAFQLGVVYLSVAVVGATYITRGSLCLCLQVTCFRICGRCILPTLILCHWEGLLLEIVTKTLLEVESLREGVTASIFLMVDWQRRVVLETRAQGVAMRMHQCVSS